MSTGRYRLENKLGQGGMGVVYRAYDTQTGQVVALKLLINLFQPKALERFMREIRIASSLHHEHLLPILDSGYLPYNAVQVPFHTTPFMPDGSLDRLMRQRPPWVHWTLLETADVILQAAAGLQYMHEQTPPKVHQDVKPENFLVSLHPQLLRPGRPVHLYLADFGISRERLGSLEMTNTVMATCQYGSPEQFRGYIHCGADQYALALLSCQLLTGRFPLQGSSLYDWMNAHMNEQPVPPSVLAPQRIASTRIDSILLTALSKDPEQRYPSVIDFANDLYDALLEQTTASEHTVFVSVNGPHLEATELEVVATPPVVLPAQSDSDRVQAGEVTEFLPSSTQLPVNNELLTPFVPEVPLFDIPLVSRKGRKQIPVEVDEPLPSFGDLTQIASSKETLPDLLALNEILRLELGARPVQLSWSPAGDVLLAIFYRHPPLLIKRDGSMRKLPLIGLDLSACWAPDGRLLAIRTETMVEGERSVQIRSYDVVSGGNGPSPLLFPSAHGYGLDWSAQNELAVWVDDQIFLYAFSTSSSSLWTVLPSLPLSGLRSAESTGILRWSPDGNILALGTSDGRLLCWQRTQGRILLDQAARGQDIYSLAWSHDGQMLAVAYRDRRVDLWQMSVPTLVRSWSRLPVVPRLLAFSLHHGLTIASDKPYLLTGSTQTSHPSARLSGQWLVSWSAHEELAVLSETSRTVLVIARP